MKYLTDVIQHGFVQTLDSISLQITWCWHQVDEARHCIITNKTSSLEYSNKQSYSLSIICFQKNPHPSHTRSLEIRGGEGGGDQNQTIEPNWIFQREKRSEPKNTSVCEVRFGELTVTLQHILHVKYRSEMSVCEPQYMCMPVHKTVWKSCVQFLHHHNAECKDHSHLRTIK